MSSFQTFLPKTLFSKILWLIYLLILLQFLSEMFLAYLLLWKTLAETEQHRQWGVAEDIAREIQPVILGSDTNGIDYIKLRSTVAEFQRFNPAIDIYVLSAAGEVLADFGRSREVVRKKIDPTPLTDFIKRKDGGSDARLTADDPRSEKGQAVFSAAPVRLINEENGFVYIPLLRHAEGYVLELFAKSASFKTFILCSVLILFAITTAGLLALRGVSRAFETIMSSVRSYAEGRFDVAIPLDREDELGAVAKVLNAMGASLAEKIQELRRKDELRRELIMDVVHDLRGPTGTMKGFLELLRDRDGSASSAERAEYYGSVERGLEQLSSLTEELSQLHQLELGKLKPVVLACDAISLAKEIASFYEKRGAAMGITVTANCPAQLPPVLCDKVMIRRVLQNLVENALRYTDLDGRITVRLSGIPGAVEFAVEDTGIGISQTALPRIFNRTFQAETSDDERKGQSGLGLAIVKKIIEAHQSEVAVASSENIGTTFSFRLPVTAEAY